MKVLALVLALITASGCGANLPELTADASTEIDKAADRIETGLDNLRKEIQPYAQTALTICALSGDEGEPCKALKEVAERLFLSLDQASRAVKEFRAGKAQLSVALEALQAAVSIAEEYARAVLREHARIGQGA